MYAKRVLHFSESFNDHRNSILDRPNDSNKNQAGELMLTNPLVVLPRSSVMNSPRCEVVESPMRKIGCKRDGTNLRDSKEGSCEFLPERSPKSPRTQLIDRRLRSTKLDYSTTGELLLHAIKLENDDSSLLPLCEPNQTSSCDQELFPITPEEARKFSESGHCVQSLYSKQISIDVMSEDGYLLYCPRGILNDELVFCYMNSVVQALGNLPLFSMWVVHSAADKKLDLIHALSEIYKYCWVRPEDVIRGVAYCPPLTASSLRTYYANNHADKFNPNKQQDAEEFLEDIVDRLEKETEHLGQGSGDDNPVTKMFRGYLQRQNGPKEYFYTLRLGIANDSVTSVESAFYQHLLLCEAFLPSTDEHREEASLSGGCSPNSDSTPEIIEKETTLVNDKPMLPLKNVSPHAEGDKPMLPLKNVYPHAERKGVFPSISMKSVEQVNDINDHTSDSEESMQTMMTEVDSGQHILKKKASRICLKIHLPDILCLSLVRRVKNYSYNVKLIKAENSISISPELLVGGPAKGVTYKLMSSIHYVCMGLTGGHYYTCTDSGRGDHFKLDDGTVYRGPRDALGEEHLGPSSIIVYAKVPDTL